MNCQKSQNTQARATELVLWLSNLRGLVAAYGEEFREAAKQKVRAWLAGCAIPTQALQEHDEIILIHLAIAWAGVDFDAGLEDAASLRIRAGLESVAVEYDGVRAYLKIQTGFLREPTAKCAVVVQDVISGEVDTHCLPPVPTLHESWCSAYREDMAKSVRLLDDIRAGRILLAFQPIRLLDESTAVPPLYDEVLLRHESEANYAIHESIMALERMGLVTRLDRSVIWSAIAVLERHRDKHLGINISAYSLREGDWWRELFSYLERHSCVAKRLTVEITETSSITQADEALAITASLQVRGTRVALDDVGAGHSTLEFLARINADVVKIDRSIFLRSRDLRHSPDLLRNLVRVCADYSPCVVVEGIESELELRAARYARVNAVQGFFLGTPSVQPDWLHEPAVVLRDSTLQKMGCDPLLGLQPRVLAGAAFSEASG